MIRSWRAAFLVVLASSILLSGCARLVKRKTKLDVPAAYQQAKSLSVSELVELINNRYAGVETLSASDFQVEFTGGSMERGYLEQYPRGKGYLVARSPDSVYVNVLNPLTSSTVAVMASQGETFQIWVPRENKYFTGKTDVELDSKDPFFNVRPQHILNGLLIERIPTDRRTERYFLEEDEDGQFKYYVLAIVEISNSAEIRLQRKLWIERSTMRLVRQQYYGPGGELTAHIRYNQPVDREGRLINTSLEIQRPHEGYSLHLEMQSDGIRINQALKEGIFEVSRPAGAQLVVVEGKKL